MNQPIEEKCCECGWSVSPSPSYRCPCHCHQPIEEKWKSCKTCKKQFRITPSSTRKFCSRTCYTVSFRGLKGENAPHWKKDEVSKSGIHVWLRKTFGTPNYCEHCKRTDRLAYDWANTNNHIYRRVREEFIRLCRSCHRKFDLTPEKKEKATKNLMCKNMASEWSFRYKVCVECGTTEHTYKSNGLCLRCYRKDLYQQTKAKKAYAKK